MVITLGKGSALEGVMQNLLDVQHTLSPGYNINWGQIILVLAEQHTIHPRISPKTFCFLTRRSIATRVNAIGVKHFRDAMSDDWTGNKFGFNREEWRTETVTKLEYYESEYRRLKESTSLLELVMWKTRIYSLDHGKAMGEGSKKLKIDQTDFRLLCRINCGADHVIENVLPYLLPPDFVRSYVVVR